MLLRMCYVSNFCAPFARNIRWWIHNKDGPVTCDKYCICNAQCFRWGDNASSCLSSSLMFRLYKLILNLNLNKTELGFAGSRTVELLIVFELITKNTFHLQNIQYQKIHEFCRECWNSKLHQVRYQHSAFSGILFEGCEIEIRPFVGTYSTVMQ